MKATGVVRRIDDLGRIVIPKELRRNLRIREGDSIEIFTDGTNSIILRKYSPIENISTFVSQYAEAIYQATKKNIIITDSERVLAANGNFKKDVIGKKIDIRLDDRMQKKVLQSFDKGETLDICDSLVITDAAIMKPITVYGDIIGCVIIVGANHITEIEKTLAETSASFIGKYLEN